MVQFDPLIKIGQQREKEIDRDGLSADIKRGDKWLVIHIKAGDNEQDELRLSKRSAGRRELVREGMHIAEVC